MRFPIDVILLSRIATVVGVRQSVQPFSVVWPNFRAKSVLELPADTVASSRTGVGDLIEIEIRDG